MNTDNYIKPKFDIIKNSKLWVAAWIALILLSILSFYNNRRFSIEFTWGLQMKVNQTNVSQTQLDENVTNFLNSKWYNASASDVAVWQEWDYQKIVVKTTEHDEAKLNALATEIKSNLVDSKAISSQANIVESSIIGPSIWEYMKKSATNAIGWGIALIALYIIFAFSGITKYIPSHLLWIAVVTSLLFDVLVPAWVYSILMALNPSYQIDLVLVISLLILMGYSINDTIIIFDRIRENINKNTDWLASWKKTYHQIFESSLWQTMRRSLFTSLATLLAVVSMYIFWSWVLKNFGLILMIWIICWTASSIFLAAPIAYLLNWKK